MGSVNSTLQYKEHFYKEHFFGSFFSSIVNVFTPIVNIVAPIVNPIISGTVDCLKDPIKCAKNIGDVISDLIPNIGNFVSNLIEPVIDLFKKAFDITNFKNLLNDALQTIKDKLPVNLLTDLANILKPVTNILSKSLNLLKEIPDIFKQFGKFIGKLYESFENIIVEMFNFFKQKFIEYKDIFEEIVTIGIESIKKYSTIAKDKVFELSVQFYNILKPLANKGFNFLKIYIMPLIKDLFGLFLDIVKGLYNFIIDRINNRDKERTFRCVLPLLGQMDEIIFGSKKLFFRPFLQNKIKKNPDCKSETLQKAAYGRIFTEKNTVASIFLIIITYIIIILLLNNLTDSTDTIPQSLIVIFSIFLYLSIVSNESVGDNIIKVFDYIKSKLPNNIIIMYKTNYTRFIIGLLLIAFEIKLIYNYILNKKLK